MPFPTLEMLCQFEREREPRQDDQLDALRYLTSLNLTEIENRVLASLINEGTQNMATTSTNSLFENFTPPTPARPQNVPVPNRNPVFSMKQNTHATEIEKLRRSYPSDVFLYDFNTPFATLFNNSRTEIYDFHALLQRIIACRHAAHNAEPKFKEPLLNSIEHSFSSRDFEYIRNINLNLKESRAYRNYLNTRGRYAESKRQYIAHKKRYRANQAEFYQRSAMIRQRPEKSIDIDRVEIMNALLTWENVWGVATSVDINDNSLYVRVGFCDIVMTDSANKSAYVEPPEILLAPFYVTVQLTHKGVTICYSRNSMAMGLSRSINTTGLSHDFHPHQLSDTPCFGTFGQSLVDAGNNGDMLSFFSILAAFYSQYNSQDSAGSNAPRFLPAMLFKFETVQGYSNTLQRAMRNNFSTHWVVLDDKLNAAVQRYDEWHSTTHSTRLPERDAGTQDDDDPLCEHCGDRPVGDQHDYFINYEDNRVCRPCWESYYCGHCERTTDDCECEHDDEGIDLEIDVPPIVPIIT